MYHPRLLQATMQYTVHCRVLISTIQNPTQTLGLFPSFCQTCAKIPTKVSVTCPPCTPSFAMPLSPMGTHSLHFSLVLLAGQSAIVFDCVLNPSIKSRALKDPDFKSFIIGIHLALRISFPSSPLTLLELALQRIEAQTTLVLSRQIATPNIASKGKPQSRRALVSGALYPPGHPNHQAPPQLIQEIAVRPTSVPDKAQPKGILKALSSTPISETRIPAWSWTQQGSRIRIVFDVPGAVSKTITASGEVYPSNKRHSVMLHRHTQSSLKLHSTLNRGVSSYTSPPCTTLTLTSTPLTLSSRPFLVRITPLMKLSK